MLLSRYLACSRCSQLTFRSLDKLQAIALSRVDPSICGRCIRLSFEEEGRRLIERWIVQQYVELARPRRVVEPGQI